MALVTGGTSGVGAILCEDLIRDHDLILVHGKSSERASQFAESLRSKAPANAKIHVISFDLTRSNDLLLLVSDVMAKLNGQELQLVIHSAGAGQTDLLLATNAEDIASLIAVNLTAPILLSKYILKAVIRNGRRPLHLVTIGSTLSLKSVRGVSAYAATKAGIEAFTVALASEVQPYGVRVNCLKLGRVATPMLDGVLKKTDAPTIAPKEIVAKMRYLLNSGVNGEILLVDVDSKS